MIGSTKEGSNPDYLVDEFYRMTNNKGRSINLTLDENI